jgi:hypothetical protein
MTRKPRVVEVPRLHLVRTRSAAVDLSAFPDFLIAGPQRTGTTWIFRNLIAHPHLFLPGTKEIYYFSTLGKPDHAKYQFDFLEDYLAIFDESLKERIKKSYDALRRCGVVYHPKWVGEATATYATLKEEAIADIASLNPQIKIVLMLRDPVERTWSHAKKEIIRRLEPGQRASEDDFIRFFQQAGQVRRSAMLEVVSKWRSHLPFDQIYLGDYAFLSSDPRGFLDDLCRFLAAPLPRRFDSPHLRATINPTTKEPLPPTLLAWLNEHLSDDIKGSDRLLRDFDFRWRQNHANASPLSN